MPDNILGTLTLCVVVSPVQEFQMSLFPNLLFVTRLAAPAHKRNNCGFLCLERAAWLGLTGSQELGNTTPRTGKCQEDKEH